MAQNPQSPLVYLGFQLLTPGQLLRPYVQSYWHFRRETPLAVYQEEYMHPRGGFGVVFNFGDTLRLDAQPIDAPLFLDGANTVSRKLGFWGRVELMGVRFREGGAYPFLGVPLHELKNEISLLDALDKPGLLRLHAQMQEAPSLEARLILLEDWLIGRLLLGKQRDAIIPASLTKLHQRDGHLPISQLAQELAISQRQLERLYQSQVGISPKQYSQLLRVEKARIALKQPIAQTTTHLAADLGFYDQAHFIREFSAVIGITPYNYQKRHRSTTP